MTRRKGTRQWKISSIVSLLLAVAMLVGSLPLTGFEVQAAEEKAAVSTEDAQASKTADSGFQHPGLLHTQAGFDKMKENIDNNVQPNRATWDALWWDTYSNPNWWPRPLEGVTRGGGRDSINQLRIDVRRAYQNALIWKVSGDAPHGEAASRIINGWTSTMKWLGGNADRFLAAGLQGYELANIGEMMRDYPGFDNEGLKNLLLNVFYPMNDDFMIRHNDAYIGNYWANWELANLASMISIGVYCDRKDIYERALNYFKTGKGNGSFYHTMPYVFEEEGVTQWQESVRDQGHTTLGVVLCGVIMETAWNQGDDLYSLSDNRFMKSVEYVAGYNSLGIEMPSTGYEYRQGKNGKPIWYLGNTDYQRGNWRPIYFQMYNHYVNRKGLEMPNLEKLIYDREDNYIEGGAGNSLDELGWYGVTYANLDERVEDVPVEGEMTDGVYRIVSAASGKSLVVNKEGNLASAAKGSRKDEWWIFKNKGDGEYTITNLMTGKRMQLNSNGNADDHNGYYSYGTQIGTGEAVDSEDGKASLTQSFAFLPETDGSFRIVPSLNYLVLSLESNSQEDNARIIQWRNDAVGAYWNFNNDAQRWRVEKATDIGAEFTFDDGSTGFRTQYAYFDGDYTLQRHGEGMALSFDGSGEFQTLGTITGKSIFAGISGFTVSFEMRPKAGSKNWIFYAAPNEENQDPAQASYLGVKEENGTVTAEVSKDGAVSAASGTVNEIVGKGSWYQVSVTFSKKETILYVNGQEIARTDRDYPITDIINENSVLQLGKANLGTGEFCQGAVDNFKFTGHVMTSEEVLSEASEFADVNLPEVLAEFTFDNEETGFTGGLATASGPHSLQDHDDGKALFLDGWRDFLKVTGKDGGSLVPGGLLKEMTITMQVKMESGIGWVFYAAPNENSPIWLQEQYLAVMDSNGEMVAQRFKNQGSHSPYPRVESKKDAWHYITIVFSETETIIYDNGNEKGRVENNIPLNEILGGNSIWQIGKANWGTGEYFRGLIDNYRILSRALTPEEVNADALQYVDKTALQEAVDKQSAEEQEIYSQERWQEYQSALAAAQQVLADEEALQGEVDPAEEALNKVQAWMRMDEALYYAVAENQEAKYTAKTWEPYGAALATAKTLNGNQESANADLETAAKTLRETQSALVNKAETIAQAISRINDIGTVEQTLECSQKAILARQTCNLLTAEELQSVTNLAVLEAAEAAMSDYLAEFTFDDNETGFIGGQAVAEGSYTIKHGALYLDGKGDWLNVTKADGSSLLTGRDELTFSFAAHPGENELSNWFFFAAPNINAQELNKETYLAALGLGSGIITERYKNDGSRPDTAKVDETEISDWVYVTVVYESGKTILYLDGEKKAEVESSIGLQDILGGNSVLQIGKGNWGNGEYYDGYLDNFKVIGRTMTPEEIKAEAEAFHNSSIDVAKIENVIQGIDGLTTIEATVEMRKTLEEIRANYESLNPAEQELVTNIETLAGAEEVYQEKVEDAEAVLVEFTLDDAENGLKGSGAVAEIKSAGEGSVTEFTEDEDKKAISMDGSSWLEVKKEDGSALLTDVEELTVSYYSKAGRTETNWAFYAAPNGDAQAGGAEKYIGVLENNKNVTAERFLNGRQPSASAVYEEGWNHIVVVYGADDTKLYVNGVLANTAVNNGALTEILGRESVLQLGKANWGDGEYYLGLLDDVKIYNHAFTQREVKILRGEIADPKELKAKIQEAKLVNQRNYTEESYAALREAIRQARKDMQTADTEEQVAEAVAKLQKAISELVPKTLDKAALEAKITEAKAIEKGENTQASYDHLQEAIEAAETALSSAILQHEIDQALEDLENAIGALKKLIYTELDNLIAQAKDLEEGKFTDETYQALQTAIQTAENARETAAAQADVDQAVIRLQEAIDALERKDTEEPGGPDNPGKPDNPGNDDNKDVLVKELKINPSNKNVTVGESFAVEVMVSPDDATNKEVELSSNNSAVAQISGKTVKAVGAGEAVITAKALDGSKMEASLKVKVSLNPVTTVKAVQQSSKKYVTVSYNRVNGAASYDIYRSTKASSGYKKIGSSAKINYVDKKAAAGKTYYYKVIAKAKTGGYDSVISAKYAKVKVLAVPKVKTKAAKGRKVTVSWRKIKGASGYVVYTSTKKTKGFKAVKTIKKAKTIKAVIKAKKNVKKLYVKVRPYYLEKGRRIPGTYSKVMTVKIKN